MLTPLAPASANSRASSPGWSGTETKTDAVGRVGPPCLPGMARVPATPSGEDLASARPVAGRRRASIRASSWSRTSASRSSTAVGLADDDLPPERRVARRDPGHVADALAGQGQVLGGRVGQPAGDQRGEQVRQVGGPGDGRGRAPPGSAAPARAPHSRRQRLDQLDGVRVGRRRAA